MVRFVSEEAGSLVRSNWNWRDEKICLSSFHSCFSFLSFLCLYLLERLHPWTPLSFTMILYPPLKKKSWNLQSWNSEENEKAKEEGPCHAVLNENFELFYLCFSEFWSYLSLNCLKAYISKLSVPHHINPIDLKKL